MDLRTAVDVKVVYKLTINLFNLAHYSWFNYLTEYNELVKSYYLMSRMDSQHYQLDTELINMQKTFFNCPITDTA